MASPNSTDALPSIYLIRAESGHYKIGYSHNPGTRLKSLQVGSPLPLQLEYQLRTARAPLLEAQLHRLYADRRISGEWFTLSPADIAAIKALAETAVTAVTVGPSGQEDPPTPVPGFGGRLTRLRRDRQMTQTDLARKSGLKQSTISRLEAGTQRPWLATVASLAEGLDVDLAELID